MEAEIPAHDDRRYQLCAHLRKGIAERKPSEQTRASVMRIGHDRGRLLQAKSASGSGARPSSMGSDRYFGVGFLFYIRDNQVRRNVHTANVNGPSKTGGRPGNLRLNGKVAVLVGD